VQKDVHIQGGCGGQSTPPRDRNGDTTP
jgi:hypothetical protein